MSSSHWPIYNKLYPAFHSLSFVTLSCLWSQIKMPNKQVNAAEGKFSTDFANSNYNRRGIIVKTRVIFASYGRFLREHG